MSTNQQLDDGVQVEEFLENHYDGQSSIKSYWEDERWLAVENEDKFLIRDQMGEFDDLSYDGRDEFLEEVRELMPGRYAGIQLEDGSLEIYDRTADRDEAVISDTHVDLEEKA